MKTIITLFLSLLITSAYAQFTCGDTLIDTRDGKRYPTVQIGNQCWLASNLNIGTMVQATTNVNAQSNNSTIEKYCYNNVAANCDTFGGLYMWDEMMDYTSTQGIQGICPNGWHLPSVEEWDTLFANYNSSTVAIDLQIGGSSGFNALPSGYCYHNYSNWVFGSLGSYGVFRTTAPSSTSGSNYSTVFYYYPSDGTMHTGNYYKKTNGYSVRCIWNGPTTGKSMIEKSSEVKISDPYPNPSNGQFTISIDTPKNCNSAVLEFYNLEGKLIMSKSIDTAVKNITISSDGFKKGTYFYYLKTSKNNSTVKKLIIN